MNESVASESPGLTGSATLSWPVWLIASTVPIALLALFGNFGNAFAGLLAIVISAVISAPFLLIPSRFVLPRLAGSLSRLVTVTLAFLFASSASSITITLAISAVTRSELAVGPMVLSGIIFHSWFYVLTAEIVNDRAALSRQTHRLDVVRSQLRAFETWSEVHHASFRTDELVRISHQINVASARIASAVGAQESIRGLSDDVIRTLLTDLGESAESAAPSALQESASHQRQRTFRRVVDLAFSPQKKLALPVALFIASTWVATGLSQQSWATILLATLAAGTVLYLLLTLLQILLAKIKNRATQIIGLLTGWLIFGVAAGIAPIAISGIPASAIVAIGVQTLIITFVFSVIIAYRVSGEKTNQLLDEENQNLDRELVMNAAELRTFRNQLRHSVHGELQSVLIAVERKLLARSDVSRVEADLATHELRQAFSKIEHRLLQSPPESTPQQVIHELQAVWDGAIDITAQWESGTEALIARSMVTRNVLSDVIVEIITNTAKHDLATRVELTFSLIDDRTLQVSSHSVGPLADPVHIVGKSAKARPNNAATVRQGRGHELMDAVCLSWSLDRHRGETVVTAVIPVIEDVTLPHQVVG